MTVHGQPLQAALHRSSSHASQDLRELIALAALPSVSAPYRGAALEPAADRVAGLLRSSGLTGVELLSVPGAPPYVYGKWLGAAGAATVLAYGHYDVQPPGDPVAWRTPPFEPVVRRGRLYARGAADDKGGVVALAVARARLSLRTVADLEPDQAAALLRRRLLRRPPFGAQVSVRPLGGVPWWSTDPESTACEAALRALRAGYGRAPWRIAAGGSIGFLRPFSELMGGAPCLLMGLEDPPCNAHAANESLHLGDWRRAIRALVHLFDELSRGALAPAGR